MLTFNLISSYHIIVYSKTNIYLFIDTFQYNPSSAVAVGTVPDDIVRLVTLSLFLVPGTPILNGLDKRYFDAQKKIIKQLSDFREQESIQVGNMTFANTTEDVIAYARLVNLVLVLYTIFFFFMHFQSRGIRTVIIYASFQTNLYNV